MGAQGKGVALLYGNYILVHIEFKKLLHHICSLGSADDLHPGISEEDVSDGGTVVGLHVIDDQVVQRASIQHRGCVFQELVRKSLVDGVKEGCFFI